MALEQGIGKLEIYAYTHVDKEINSEYMGFVELNKTYTYEIKISDDKYLFRFDGIEISTDRGCDSNNTTILGYRLEPYFGGAEKAPHDIYIFAEEIDEKQDILSIEMTNLYPNPACEEVSIAMENHSKEPQTIKMRIYDLAGKLILGSDPETVPGSCSYTKSMYVNTLDPGYYFVTISNELNYPGLAQELTNAKKMIKACKGDLTFKIVAL